MLGLMSGHTYYYLSEVMPRLDLPEKPRLDDVFRLLVHGTPLGAGDATLPGSLAETDAAAAEDGADGDSDEAMADLDANVEAEVETGVHE